MTLFDRARAAFGLPGVVAFGMVVLFAAARPAAADTISFTLSGTISGQGTPLSDPPWLTATFEDVGLDTVQLTLTSSLEESTEFIDEVVFNTTTALTDINYFSGGTWATTEGGNPGWTWTYSLDGVNLGAGGSATQGFDVRIDFDNSDGGAVRFDDFDTAVFTLIGTGLTASSFYATNSSGYYMAAHVQGIQSTPDSAPIVAPEPLMLTLFGLGLGAVAYRARRRT